MSIFGRGLSPDLISALKSRPVTWESRPAQPSGALDRVREKAWNQACQYAYDTGNVSADGLQKLLQGNPYK